MKQTLRELLFLQSKSKIKAGAGQSQGAYNFYTSSQTQSKFYHTATYTQPALIFGTGGMASVHYCSKPFSTSTDCLVMYGNQGVSLELIYHYLRTNIHILQDGFKGAGLQHISKDYILDIEIDMPEPAVQEKIAHQMRLIDGLINGKKQQIVFFDEVVKSRFIEMFGESRTNLKGWNTILLEQLAAVGSSKRVFVEELQEKGIPFYRGTEVGALAEGHQIKPELYITEEHYRSLIEATGAPAKGDLLMPSICSDGRIWLVDTDTPFYFKDGRVLWIHPTSSEICSCYLQHFLKEKIMTDYDSIASGTTFAELKIFALKSLRVMMPPLELQEQFATFVKQVDKSKYRSFANCENFYKIKKTYSETDKMTNSICIFFAVMR